MKNIYHSDIYKFEKPVNSYWEDTTKENFNLEKLVKDITSEVVVIGGGYTGLLCAINLIENYNLDVILLEAGKIGWGASSRNGGFCAFPPIKTSYKNLQKIYDPKLNKFIEYENEINIYVENNTNSKDNNKAFYFTIYPNILFNIAPGRLQTNTIEPIDEQNCNVIFDYYFEDVSEKKIREDILFSEEVQNEDIYICEKVQKGLKSDGFNQGIFSEKYEIGRENTNVS